MIPDLPCSPVEHMSQSDIGKLVSVTTGTLSKKRRSTGKFPFKWNRGWLNFDSLAAAASGKFVSSAKVLAAKKSLP